MPRNEDYVVEAEIFSKFLVNPMNCTHRESAIVHKNTIKEPCMHRTEHESRAEIEANDK